MKVQHGKEVAIHSGHESCGATREGASEALTVETAGQPLSREISESGVPTQLQDAEGNIGHGAKREPCSDSTRSETLNMRGSFLCRSWEISAVSAAWVAVDGSGKATSRTPDIDAAEKSDASIVPKKRPNKGEEPAEGVEGRGATKRNVVQSPAPRTQCRAGASKGLDGVREVARRDRRAKFTALLHHVNPELLKQSFLKLKRGAVPGIDGMTWREYEEGLDERIECLYRAVHTGRYRALPSRRVYIDKSDGTKRPLGIAALEDKIVQQAVATVLSAIYESDFLGFSYGFRTGRGQHDALDALWIGIMSRKVNWILDFDIRSFFDTLDHTWMLRFLDHRVADRRILRLVRKWLKAGVIEAGQRTVATVGSPQGSVISPFLANLYLHYVLDLWAHQWRRQQAHGEVIIVRYADDGVMGFEHRHDAEQFLAAMRDRFAKFGLALHPEKTRLIEFGRFAAARRKRQGLGKPEVFNFLGFTHICSKTRKGQFQVLRLTIKKRLRAKLQAIREELMARRHEPVREIGQWLGRVLTGYFNYHAVLGNGDRLAGFRKAVCRSWLHALRRRSQRTRMTWARFQRLVLRHLPVVRVRHYYPYERLRATT